MDWAEDVLPWPRNVRSRIPWAVYHLDCTAGGRGHCSDERCARWRAYFLYDDAVTAALELWSRTGVKARIEAVR